MRGERFFRYGYYLAGLTNIVGILVFSRALTNDLLYETQPTAFSTSGLLLIMTWGAAYLATAKAQATTPLIGVVFAVEKLIYVGLWITFLRGTTTLASLYEHDLMTGLFFSIYGVVDGAFCLFFVASAWRARTP